MDANELLKKRYLNEVETSCLTGFALSTLRNNRHLRRGIPFLKISKSVRYKTEDVVALMESQRIVPDVREARRLLTEAKKEKAA